MKSGFYQKNGFAIRMISREFLSYEEGARIPSIDEYTNRLGVSRWVIQVALNYIEETGCVQYEKRGVLGTFVHDLNMEKLWEVADLKPIVGLFPFPTCCVQDGLVTAILEALKNTKTPVVSAYLPSSGARFSYLQKELCHFVLCSELAAKSIEIDYPDLEVAMILDGAVTGEPYYIYTHEACDIREGMTLCIHENSLEQRYIAEELKKKYNINIITGNYQEQGEYFRNNTCEIYLSRGDQDLRMFPINGFHAISLDEIGITREMITPVIIIKKESYDFKKILRKCIDLEYVKEIQNQIVFKRLPAKYL